jgi:hypothetical protein
METVNHKALINQINMAADQIKRAEEEIKQIQRQMAFCGMQDEIMYLQRVWGWKDKIITAQKTIITCQQKAAQLREQELATLF